MDFLQIIVLALMQGITEFLPISSSAHLILPSQLLGWPDQGLAFDTAVHLGTLMAVLIYFRRDIQTLILAVLAQAGEGRSTEESRFAWNLLIASLPVIPAGFLLRFIVEEHLRTTTVIAGTTIIFALALVVADRMASRTRQAATLTWQHALAIGVGQCLALVPGTSRSGITITCALLAGYTREAAARISFLISIPAIGGAATLKTWDLVQSTEPVDWLAMGLGMGIAGISAYLCIRWFLALIDRIGFMPFVVYRLLLGGVLILLLV